MKKIFLSIIMLSVMNAFCQQKAFKVEVYGTGQPVILIPGYACSGDVWKSTVDALKGKYQLQVLTIAGFAGVPPIDTPVLKTVKNELIQYVKQNHLNKPVLIGHGLGAFMSLWAASEEPSLFAKILCVDDVPYISPTKYPATSSIDIKKEPAYNAETVAYNFVNMPEKEFKANQFKAMRNMVKDSTRARLITNWTAASDRKTLSSVYAEIGAIDLRNAISKINIPVLILGSVFRTKELSKKLFDDEYSNLANKLILIAPTKHFIMYDDPLWFREEVKNFLRNGLTN
jgi:N-formylmaleamate deformylase